MKIGLVNRENPVIAHILDKGIEDDDSRRIYSSKKSEYCSNIKFLSIIFYLLKELMISGKIQTKKILMRLHVLLCSLFKDRRL